MKPHTDCQHRKADLEQINLKKEILFIALELKSPLEIQAWETCKLSVLLIGSEDCKW